MTTATAGQTLRFDIPEYARENPERHDFLEASTRVVVVHLPPTSIAAAAATLTGVSPATLEDAVRTHIDRLVPTCSFEDQPQYLESVPGGVWEGDGPWDEWNPTDYRPLSFTSQCPIRLSVGHLLDDQALHISIDETFADPAGSTYDRQYLLGQNVLDEPDIPYVVFQVRALSEGDAVETVREILAMAVHAATTRPDATTAVPKTLTGPPNGPDDAEFVIELSRSWRTVRVLMYDDYATHDWVRAFADQFDRVADDRFTAAEEHANALGDVGEWTPAAPDDTFDFRASLDAQYCKGFGTTPWDEVPISANAPDDAFRIQIVVNAQNITDATVRATKLVKYVTICAERVHANANGYRAA